MPAPETALEHVLSPLVPFAERPPTARSGAGKPVSTSRMLRQAMQDGKPAVIHVKVDPDAVLSFRRDALQKRE